MAGVRCISSSLVQASSTHRVETQRIELTQWDLRLLPVGPIQKGLLFGDGEISDGNTFVDTLKSSLSSTLHHFPPLAGRLATAEVDDETISFFIDCNDAGALFVHAEADGVTISDIVKPVYVPSIIHSFFPLNGIINYDGISQPLLGVQVTKLFDGVFIGCTINHSVVDGESFWHFINSWSEISRGSIHLLKPPIYERSFFNDKIEYPIRIPRFLVEEFRGDGDQFIPPALLERIFHFSKQNITKLKAKANAEVRTNISSLQALLSHLWQSIIRNKKLIPDEETSFYLTIGARPRLHDVPERYFGNAAKGVIITMKAKELRERRIGDIASEMNTLVHAHTEEVFKRDMESWIANPKFTTMRTVSDNFMLTSSSPRFNMYGNDFGWGRPIAVRSGLANKLDGKLTLFCGSEEGSIDVELCLSAETLEAMAKDDEFMELVTM